MTEDEKIEQVRAEQASRTPDALAARRAAAAKKIEDATRAAEEARELLMIEAEEVLAEIVVAHGPKRALIFGTNVGPLVLERGMEPLYTRFMKEFNTTKGNPSDKEIRHFVTSCISYPKTPAEVNKLFTAQPGALNACAILLTELYGAKGAEDSPK